MGLSFMKTTKELLLELNLIDLNELEVFSTKTRDKDNITVLRDKKSGIIFLEDFITDDTIYEQGGYRTEGTQIFGKRDYEITVDVRRRLTDYEQFYVGKRVLDFGCGEGSFLREIKGLSQELCGVELEKSYVKDLRDTGINCVNQLDEIESGSLDTIFCFHTLEHLKEPLKFLMEFKRLLKPKGNLIIEVPHSNDFLLRYLECEPFKRFTLWSQHLILHSRVSLERFLRASGYNNFIIQGKQRYNVSNHLHWLRYGKPGGHKSTLSSLDNDELSKVYQSSLQMIDATDTLVAVISND
jgi:2-polyprenyl-3-methyl-5-hydroxy-6-metoxy-1,4-benzoquinol methylase